jgi:hypothetical protein
MINLTGIEEVGEALIVYNQAMRAPERVTGVQYFAIERFRDAIVEFGTRCYWQGKHDAIQENAAVQKELCEGM